MRRLCCWGLAAIFLSCWLSAAAAADVTLLRGATVHPVAGPALESASVLISGGKIQAVGRALKAPAGARVLDVRGLHVYPGMTDAASFLGLSEISALRVTVDTEEIGDFRPQLRALVAVNPASEHIPVTRVNGVTNAVVFPAELRPVRVTERGVSAAMIAGQASVIHLDGWTWEEMAVQPGAALLIRLPEPARTGPPSGASAASAAGLLRTPFSQLRYWQQLQRRRLDDYFEQARMYRAARSSPSPQVPASTEYEAMIPVLDGKQPVVIPAEREREILDAIEFASTHRLKLILAGVRKPGKALDRIREAGIPVILGPVLALPLEEDDPYDAAFTLPAELHRAGVKFAFATMDTQFARNLPYQAATAAAYGLPYEAALRALTLNPAEIFGVADLTGSIEPGKIANLIVTDGDPLETRTQIKHLFIQGKPVSLSTKHTRLFEQYRNRQ